MEKATRPFNNRNLFSNHYLENQIKASPEWGWSDHEAAFEKIRRIYEREAAFVGGLSEAQLEERLIRRVFAVILPEFEVQGATRSREFPDYAFFPHREARDRAQAKKDTESFFLEAFAIGEVKRWDAELDRFGRDRQDKRRNPSFQIWLYLTETEPAWGILSNGGRWRLYRQDRPLDVYYEVDLAALLADNDVDAFRYFYYFFRKEAFLPNQRGEVFLEEVLRGSANYAREIGENLKENVYRAGKVLADGFIRWPENRLDPGDAETRARVQRSTMILLYRFLFLLYAEGKELLDLKDERYASSYSFDRIKKEVALRRDGPAAQGFLPIKRSLWSDLSDLFRLIDRGSERLGIGELIEVPAYNGGLFDPGRHPYLAEWTIGDSYLAEAIDLLSRSEAGAAGGRGGGGRKKDEDKDAGGAGGAGKGFVDYSTLEIRHLGSIYEGLLEYSLQVADKDLVVSGGKDRRWLPLAEYNQGKKKERRFEEFGEFDRARAGELYLTTDRGERKATGSYYTPDYIVDYIVEKTVGPVVEERWKEALLENKSLIEATLSVKVLDPAMGSGHFLVGAVEFLAGKLLRAAERDIDWGWVEDRGQFTPEWAKREAVARCIYGVDLNELAVELAKVSLWLSTIAKDKPLSFLDHRLKQGNSLVGARLSDLMNYPGSVGADKDQTTLPSFVSPRFLTHLIGKIRELEEIGDDSLSEIKEKERVFEEFRSLPEYTKAKAIANVHTAVYFGGGAEARATPQGTKDPDQVYHDLFWAVGGDEAEWRRKTSPRWFSEAQRIAGERSFFHWELEFPEVFFAGGAVKDNPGWDAVVGNPPYFRIDDPKIKAFLSSYYEKIYDGGSDIFHFFLYRGIDLLKNKYCMGYIIARYFLDATSAEKTRNFIVGECQIKEIVDFGGMRPFESVSIQAIILILRRGIYETLPTSITMLVKDDSSYSEVKNSFPNNKSNIFIKYDSVLTDDFGSWVFHSLPVKNLLNKIRINSVKLGDLGEIVQSMQTGKNQVFVLPQDEINNYKIERELLKPIVKSGSVRRYYVRDTKSLLIWTEGIDLDKYPNTKKYLFQFKEELSSRYDIKSRNVPWWFISNPRSADKFEKELPRILTPYMSPHNRFYVDNTGYFNDGGDIRAIFPFSSSLYSPYYLVSILNSTVAEYYHHRTSKRKDAGKFEYFGDVLEKFPICRISFSTPEAERRRFFEELSGLCAAGQFDKVLEVVDSCLPMDASGEFVAEAERSDVVHDLLAHLAEEMIRMNREKQEEIRGFLAWLSDFTGARIDDLSNKTKVSAYYEIEFSELLGVLKKNKRKLACDPGRRAFGEDLRREYSASVEKLGPLLLRIGEVDRLIDAIVYRLYGLSEAEVEIVEGSLE